jgi:hypothetical protein
LVFGYYDGPTHGVLEVGGTGEVYRFELIDDQQDLGKDVRLFELDPLPNDALNSLTSILSPYIKPAWPYWVVRWMFPSPEVQADVEAQVDEVLRQAGPVVWRVTTTDLLGTLNLVEKVGSESQPLNENLNKEGYPVTRSDPLR